MFADFLEDPDWVIGVVVMPVSNEMGRHTTHRRPHADAAHRAEPTLGGSGAQAVATQRCVDLVVTGSPVPAPGLNELDESEDRHRVGGHEAAIRSCRSNEITLDRNLIAQRLER
jgi:hypothetical protein